MSKSVWCSVFLVCCMGLVGCSDAGTPALTEPGVDPSPEQQKDWMEESMKHGGAPKGYKPPKEGEEKK